MPSVEHVDVNTERRSKKNKPVAFVIPRNCTAPNIDLFSKCFDRYALQ